MRGSWRAWRCVALAIVVVCWTFVFRMPRAEACPSGIAFTDCTGCHSPSVGTTPNVSITGIPGTVVAGNNYDLTIHVQQSGGPNHEGGFSFQVSAGTLTVID